MIFLTLGPCHRLEHWRTNVNWSINNKHEPRQAYRGLLNPGCICYLNSLLQQLFMIDDFRLAVFDINNANPSKMIEEGD